MLAKLSEYTYKPFLVYPDKTERFVYLLVFLFPIAGMSVRHWITNIFNLLVLIGLFTILKKRKPLLKEEKIFLWICAAYFSMFIISALGNGWGDPQTRYLGTEMRFIFVIPLYFLVRRYPDCAQWLLRGSIIGGFFLFAQAYYDVEITGKGLALGVYSKNIIGPFSVLIGFWGLYYVWQIRRYAKPWVIFMCLAAVLAALFAAGMSGSRGAYVGFIVTASLCIMFFSKPRWMFSSLLAMLIISYSFYQQSEIVKSGIDTAVTEVTNYFAAKDHVSDKSSHTSSGIRLEMMRTGLLFIRDNPFIGIGPGNYQVIAEKYIKEGSSSPAIAAHGYPHNAFLEVASAKGILGLITLLLLLYYPAAIFIRDYKTCKQTSVLGLIHIVAISAFSLTDHSVVLMNNYTSILLLGLAIFFSSHFHLHNKRKN